MARCASELKSASGKGERFISQSGAGVKTFAQRISVVVPEIAQVASPAGFRMTYLQLVKQSPGPDSGGTSFYQAG